MVLAESLVDLFDRVERRSGVLLRAMLNANSTGQGGKTWVKPALSILPGELTMNLHDLS